MTWTSPHGARADPRATPHAGLGTAPDAHPVAHPGNPTSRSRYEHPVPPHARRLGRRPLCSGSGRPGRTARPGDPAPLPLADRPDLPGGLRARPLRRRRGRPLLHLRLAPRRRAQPRPAAVDERGGPGHPREPAVRGRHRGALRGLRVGPDHHAVGAGRPRHRGRPLSHVLLRLRRLLAPLRDGHRDRRRRRGPLPRRGDLPALGDVGRARGGRRDLRRHRAPQRHRSAGLRRRRGHPAPGLRLLLRRHLPAGAGSRHRPPAPGSGLRRASDGRQPRPDRGAVHPALGGVRLLLPAAHLRRPGRGRRVQHPRGPVTGCGGPLSRSDGTGPARGAGRSGPADVRRRLDRALRRQADGQPSLRAVRRPHRPGLRLPGPRLRLDPPQHPGVVPAVPHPVPRRRGAP